MVPTLSERIRRARRISGLTQSQLSGRLGVLRGAVTQWERPGGALPNMKHLIGIAQHTGVNLEWLGTGRGEACPTAIASVALAPREGCLLDEIEQECLRLLRCMPQRMREKLIALMRIMVH